MILDFMASGINIILQEWMLDGDFIRFALLCLVPILFSVSLFFSLQIVQNLSYSCVPNHSLLFHPPNLCFPLLSIGPIAQYHSNSKYYSAVPPAPNRLLDVNLPHITVEMPVYKESLKETMFVDSHTHH